MSWSRGFGALAALALAGLLTGCFQPLYGEAAHPGLVADRSLLVAAEVTYVVQVNGKKRGELMIERDADPERVERAALALDAVVRAMDNKPRRRVIIVPHRIVNVVV